MYRFPPYTCAKFFQCFNSIFAKSCTFTEPVLKHLVNVYCQSYLLYGADVITYNFGLCYAFHSMCKIYKVKFECSDIIYTYTGQTHIAEDILRRSECFMYNCMQSSNAVVRLCTYQLSLTFYLFLPINICLSVCCLPFFWWIKDLHS